MIVAEMNFPEIILGNARRLQQDLIKWDIRTIRLVLDSTMVQRLDGGSNARLDFAARTSEPLGGNFKIEGLV